MKSKFRWLFIGCFIIAGAVTPVVGDETSSKTPALGEPGLALEKKAAVATPDEQIVRATYEKLSTYN